MPAYANRERWRQAEAAIAEPPDRMLLAGPPTFIPLAPSGRSGELPPDALQPEALQPEALQPEALQPEALQQVAFAVLEQGETPFGPSSFERIYQARFLRREDSWTLQRLLFRDRAAAPPGSRLSAAAVWPFAADGFQDGTDGPVARAIGLWLRDCRATVGAG